MNINKETLKLLAEIQDIHSNAENAYEEMLSDYAKEQSILGKQKAKLLIKTFEEKPLSEIDTDIDINGQYILVIRIGNNTFYIKDNWKYQSVVDVQYLFNTGEETIYINIDSFLTDEFIQLLNEVKEYTIKKKDMIAWEENTKKKKEEILLLRIINGRHDIKKSYNRRCDYAR